MNKELFAEELKKFLPYNCLITFKSRYLIQIKKHIFNTHISIHPVFLKAGKIVFNDIITFILNKDKSLVKDALNRLNIFYSNNYQSKNFKINLESEHKNLIEFYNEIIVQFKNKFNDIDFNELKITWGKKFFKKRYRSIRFGSFDKRKNLIRINPLLDKENIPDYFIKSVIYHEIIHYVIHKLHSNNKTHHNKIFYSHLKNMDPDFNKSKIWQKENLILFFK